MPYEKNQTKILSHIFQQPVQSENKIFYPALNGLRGLAVSLVFFHHYIWDGYPGSKELSNSLGWGWTGVELFFVLSGFLITGILYDTRNEQGRFRTFYIRRSLRIFPLYYGVFIALLVTWHIFHWAWHPKMTLWLLYLGNYSRYFGQVDFQYHNEFLQAAAKSHHFLTVPLSHLWSLCVEEQFYLMWPLIVFCVKDNLRLRRVCIGVFFACLFARSVCQWTLPADYLQADFIYRFTPLRVDSFLVGGFIALFLRKPSSVDIRKFARPLAIILPLLFIIAQAIHYVRNGQSYSFYAAWVQTFGYSLIDLFAGSIILLAIDPSTWVAHFLKMRWLCGLGQISYGFYFYHYLLKSVFAGLSTMLCPRHPSWIYAPIALIMSLLLSVVSFRFFEKPFLRLKDLFIIHPKDPSLVPQKKQSHRGPTRYGQAENISMR